MRTAQKIARFVACAVVVFAAPAASAGAAVPVPPPGTLLTVDYESGDTESGQPAAISTPPENVGGAATSPDIVQMDTEHALYGAYAVRHQTVLGDPGYYATGQLRSESAHRENGPTQSTVPMFRSYQFSFSLDDWEYWAANPTAATPDGEGIYGADLRSVIWQFKRTAASPVEAYFAVRGNQLDFDWGGGGPHHPVIPDLRVHDGEWIDIRIDVEWAEDATGSYVVGVRVPGESDYTTAVELRDIPTWKSAPGGGDVGVIQWGDFRPNSSNSTMVRLKNAPITRAILHDEIRVGDTQLPPPVRPTKPVVNDELVTVAFGDTATLAAASDDTTIAPASIDPAGGRFTASDATAGGTRLVVPQQGEWRTQPDGTVTFTPVGDFTGTTTAVEYLTRGSDGGGALSMLSVTIQPQIVTQPTETPTEPPAVSTSPPVAPPAVAPSVGADGASSTASGEAAAGSRASTLAESGGGAPTGLIGWALAAMALAAAIGVGRVRSRIPEQ